MKATSLATRHAEIVESTVTALISGVLSLTVIGLAAAGIIALYNFL